MSEGLILLVVIVFTGALMLFFFGAARAAPKPVSKHRRVADDEIAIIEDEHEWLDQPGDGFGSGWTNFDYIAAEEVEDMWDGDE